MAGLFTSRKSVLSKSMPDMWLSVLSAVAACPRLRFYRSAPPARFLWGCDMRKWLIISDLYT
jgi:hypothetical protein